MAVVVTGIVVLVAYGAAQVSFEARARLGWALQNVQGSRATRELLQDALRNARAPQRPAEPGFTLDDDRLSFVASGAGPPFDPDYDWQITVQPDSAGVVLVAVPTGRAPAAQVAFRLPGVTRWDVQVLAPGGAQWLRQWRSSFTTPRAISITMWKGSEQAAMPIRLALQPLSIPTFEDYR